MTNDKISEEIFESVDYLKRRCDELAAMVFEHDAMMRNAYEQDAEAFAASVEDFDKAVSQKLSGVRFVCDYAMRNLYNLSDWEVAHDDAR